MSRLWADSVGRVGLKATLMNLPSLRFEHRVPCACMKQCHHPINLPLYSRQNTRHHERRIRNALNGYTQPCVQKIRPYVAPLFLALTHHLRAQSLRSFDLTRGLFSAWNRSQATPTLCGTNATVPMPPNQSERYSHDSHPSSWSHKQGCLQSCRVKLT